MDAPEKLKFLTEDQVRSVRNQFGTPVYVMDEASLLRRAAEVMAFPNAFGITPRFAMKANPNRQVLSCLHGAGLHIDASSGYECHRAMRAGIPADCISLSSQQLPEDLRNLIELGIEFNATSLNQIRQYGRLFPGTSLGVRLNPGMGSGSTNRTNVGGPASSFGIWHEQIPEVQQELAAHSLSVKRVHTHIGSGSDPEVWTQVATMSLNLLKHFPDATTLNLGGGFKVARMATEKATDLQTVGTAVKASFEAFAAETGRHIKLEIEPGTYLVANAGAIVSTIQDVASTGASGYRFLKLDTGMTEVLRPSLYGAQHPLIMVTATPEKQPRPTQPTLVCGHCCESGDVLTPAPGDPEALAPRELPMAAIGDLLVIEGAGAYCAAMPAGNYNSFPLAAEVMRKSDGNMVLTRRRQSLDQMLANEQ